MAQVEPEPEAELELESVAREADAKAELESVATEPEDEAELQQEKTLIELLPCDTCVAECQFSGRRKFEQVELQLDGGRLVFKSIASKKSNGGTVLREANVFGCNVGKPKKGRKGHPHSIRLDLAEANKDPKGDTKYILSMASAELELKWRENLLAYSKPKSVATEAEDEAE